MSFDNRHFFEQTLDLEIAQMPFTADQPIAAAVRENLLSQIAQAGRRNDLIDLTHKLVDPVNHDEWLEERLQQMQPQELLLELIDMQRLFGQISEDVEKCVAWFRSRIESVVDENELQTSIELRVDYLLTRWIEQLEDEDFNRLVAALENAESLPIVDRLKLAERCYRDLCDLVRQREIYKEDWETNNVDDLGIKRERLTPERVGDLERRTQLVEKRTRNGQEIWRSHSAAFDINESIQHIRREAKIRSDVGVVDHVELERDTGKYGAKGANLLAARKALGGLNKTILSKVQVPVFRLLDTDTFERWREGKDITDILQDTHRWIGGKAMYIRSSAVHSEDRENLTGAGIYDSILLGKGASFEKFRVTVEQVYTSVDAPKAVEYRALNGITDPEQMGVVVQQMVSNRLGDGKKGYINTVRPHAPGLLEIVVEDHCLRCICKKDATEQQIWRGDHELGHIAYYQMDAYRHSRSQYAMARLAHIGQLLEMHFGYPVQIEFIAASRMNVNLLQVRHLPTEFLRTAAIQFPEGKQSLHESDAIGVGDMTLDVLPPERSNAERRGVVIFYRSYTMSEQYIEQYLPKEGAVVILCPSKENFGHIETLCVERGLLCIFQSGSGRQEEDSDYEMSTALRSMLSQAKNGFGEITRYEDFGGHRRVHIVADGLRAKIYPAEGEEK